MTASGQEGLPTTALAPAAPRWLCNNLAETWYRMVQIWVTSPWARSEANVFLAVTTYKRLYGWFSSIMTGWKVIIQNCEKLLA
jgi:hypothetical protein